MLSLGVDGCRAGWFVVTLSDDGVERWAIHPTFNELIGYCGEASLILVDIPIGLPTSEPRRCDSLARKLLGRVRRSSVYPVPCRQAVYASDYLEANSVNRRILGRGVSIQAWNICRRIREVDEYLRTRGSKGARVRESHPELCFLTLRGEGELIHSKRTAEGIRERLELLQALYARSELIFRAALEGFSRRDLSRDDILDALVLALTAHFFHHRLVSIPPEGQTDEYGLPMEIVYPEPI